MSTKNLLMYLDDYVVWHGSRPGIVELSAQTSVIRGKKKLEILLNITTIRNDMGQQVVEFEFFMQFFRDVN